MLTNVISDLKIFILFFSILILMFALQISIIGIANFKVDGKFKETFGEEHNQDWTQIIGYP